MNSAEYQLYLQSEAWNQKKHQRMAIDNYTCQACGCRGTSRNPLEIHHLTYTRIGSEDLYTDLVTVCRSCHTTIHSLMNRITGFYSDGSPRHGWKDNSQIGKYMQHVYHDTDGIGMIKTQQQDDEMWTE